MTREKLLEELFDVEEKLKTLKIMREILIEKAKGHGTFSAGQYVFIIQESLKRSVRVQEMIDAYGEDELKKKGLIHENKVVTTKVAKKAA